MMLEVTKIGHKKIIELCKSQLSEHGIKNTGTKVIAAANDDDVEISIEDLMLPSSDLVPKSKLVYRKLEVNVIS